MCLPRRPARSVVEGSMKVLMTTDIFPPDVGGPATFVPGLAAGLAQRGHDVTVLTWSRLRSLPGDNRYPFVLDRVPLRRSRALRLAQLWPRLIGHLRRADVVYVNGQMFSTFMINCILHRPAVAKVVGDLAWEYAQHRNLTPDDIETFQHCRYAAPVEWRRRLRNAALHRMDAVVVPSDYLARLVTAWGVAPERVRVIPNAWSPTDVSPTPADSRRSRHRLITVCRLIPSKGVHELIDIVAEFPEIDFVVVGDGPQRETLEQRAVQRGCRERVFFTGTLSRADVAARLRAADVFILNSRYEGFPHTVLEAYAARIPVIATAVGGTPEFVQHNVTGLLVSPGDRAALRHAISLLLNDDDLREQLVTRGMELLGRYSPIEMVNATEALLARTASISGPAIAGSCVN